MLKFGVGKCKITKFGEGKNKRMKYGVVGDVVNVAARLEALNKTLGTRILLSADTYESLYKSTQSNLTSQGLYSLKGRDRQVEAFAWVDEVES